MMLWPMFSLVVFTYVIMLIMAAVRLYSVGKKQVPGKYYRLMSGFNPPDYVVKPARHFSNLFETPVLFYVAGTLFIVMDIQSALAVNIAWIYVVLRMIHATVHLSYNHPVHRLVVFALSTACILTLWVLLVMYV